MLQSWIRRLFTLLWVCLFATNAFAQQPEAPPTPLRFAPGQDTLTVRGSISGYQTLDYAFDGVPGGEALISLDRPGQTSLYHNVIAPSGATIFNGSMDGMRFQSALRERGQYRIRVYLMRNDARRGKRVSFVLRIRQSMPQVRPPLPPHAAGPSFDCRRARGAVESAVCRSPSLSELDARLDFVYRDALAGAPPRHAADIRRDQRDWLAMREGCGRERNVERCLVRRYTFRIGQLEPKR